MTLDEALRKLREAGWRDGADSIAELRGVAQRSAVLSVSAAIETFKPRTAAQKEAQRAAGEAIQQVAAEFGVEILCVSCGGSGGFPHVAEECPPGAYSVWSDEKGAGAMMTTCCQGGMLVPACAVETGDAGAIAILSDTCPNCPDAPGTTTPYVCGYMTAMSKPICNILGP